MLSVEDTSRRVRNRIIMSLSSFDAVDYLLILCLKSERNRAVGGRGRVRGDSPLPLRRGMGTQWHIPGTQCAHAGHTLGTQWAHAGHGTGTRADPTGHKRLLHNTRLGEHRVPFKQQFITFSLCKAGHKAAEGRDEERKGSERSRTKKVECTPRVFLAGKGERMRAAWAGQPSNVAVLFLGEARRGWPDEERGEQGGERERLSATDLCSGPSRLIRSFINIACRYDDKRLAVLHAVGADRRVLACERPCFVHAPWPFAIQCLCSLGSTSSAMRRCSIYLCSVCLSVGGNALRSSRPILPPSSPPRPRLQRCLDP